MSDSAPEQPSAAGNMLKEFLSGGFGGACLVLAGQPFDTIKVRLQTMSATNPQFTNAMGGLRYILANEGFRGLYRGVEPALAGVAPIFAVCFWAYGVGAAGMRSIRGVETNDQLSLFDIGLAGAFSAVPTTAIMAPGERIKVMLQTQGSKYGGPLGVAKHLYQQGGISNVFKGAGATLARDSTGSLAYFSVYEGIKRNLGGAQGQLSPFAVIMGGGFAGMANWAIAYPFDTVKSRIQSGAMNGSMVSVGKEIVAKQGMGALFKGLETAMVRAFPANAACFLGMEASKVFLNKLF